MDMRAGETVDLNEAELYQELGVLTREKNRWEESIPYVSSLLNHDSAKIQAKALWLLGENGEPEPVEVETGLSDGSVTEIKTDAAIVGREAVLGVMPAMPKGAPGAGGPSNPFMPKRMSRQTKNSAKGPPPPAK